MDLYYKSFVEDNDYRPIEVFLSHNIEDITTSGCDFVGETSIRIKQDQISEDSLKKGLSSLKASAKYKYGEDARCIPFVLDIDGDLLIEFWCYLKKGFE